MIRCVSLLPVLLAGCFLRAPGPIADRPVGIQVSESTPLFEPGTRVDVQRGDDVLVRNVTVERSGMFQRFGRTSTDDVPVERYVVVYVLLTPADSARLANVANLRVVARR
jgi:hypothetical protein